MSRYPDIIRRLASSARLTYEQAAEGLAEALKVGNAVAHLGTVMTVPSSRELTDDDDGKTLECTATVSLTLPAGLRAGFACAVIPSGTTSVVSAGGTLLNGATTTVTRAVADNAMFAIQARASAPDSYIVTGA